MRDRLGLRCRCTAADSGTRTPVRTKHRQPLSALEFLRTGVNDESTTIDGTGKCDSAVATPLEPDSTLKIGGTGTKLEGFKITGGGKSGVFAQGDVTITNNVIRGNDAELGGGIYLLTASCYYSYDNDPEVDVSAVIAENLIEDNHSKAPPTASDVRLLEFCVSALGTLRYRRRRRHLHGSERPAQLRHERRGHGQRQHRTKQHCRELQLGSLHRDLRGK